MWLKGRLEGKGENGPKEQNDEKCKNKRKKGWEGEGVCQWGGCSAVGGMWRGDQGSRKHSSKDALKAFLSSNWLRI